MPIPLLEFSRIVNRLDRMHMTVNDCIKVDGIRKSIGKLEVFQAMRMLEFGLGECQWMYYEAKLFYYNHNGFRVKNLDDSEGFRTEYHYWKSFAFSGISVKTEEGQISLEKLLNNIKRNSLEMIMKKVGGAHEEKIREVLMMRRIETEIKSYLLAEEKEEDGS